MSLAALAFLTVAALAPTPPAAVPEDELVVIGRRLAALSVMVGRDEKGRNTCGLDRSTGNAALDKRLCRVATSCAKRDFARDAIKACIENGKPRLLADLRRQLARR